MKKIVLAILMLVASNAHAGASMSTSKKANCAAAQQELERDLNSIAGTSLRVIIDTKNDLSISGSDIRQGANASNRMSTQEMPIMIYVKAIKEQNNLIVQALDITVNKGITNSANKQMLLTDRIIKFLCDDRVKRSLGYTQIILESSGRTITCPK